MAYESITLVGNKARSLESSLGNYAGKDLTKLGTRRDQNTCIENYSIGMTLIRTTYNERDELDSDIAEGFRGNIGIEFLGSEDGISRAKKRLESIAKIQLIEGETTKLMKQKGLK